MSVSVVNAPERGCNVRVKKYVVVLNTRTSLLRHCHAVSSDTVPLVVNRRTQTRTSKRTLKTTLKRILNAACKKVCNQMYVRDSPGIAYDVDATDFEGCRLQKIIQPKVRPTAPRERARDVDVVTQHTFKTEIQCMFDATSTDGAACRSITAPGDGRQATLRLTEHHQIKIPYLTN
ncbi:hypothetical protein LSAT2_030265 [Lamellibrachia satsuma]|nr:hypothetical protein LSAT2_030265 [Lamellibrachia satsuma]